MSTTKNPIQFAFPLRVLHWLMAACVLAMLFIGVSMVASLGNYHTLVTIHRPLGILILTAGGPQTGHPVVNETS